MRQKNLRRFRILVSTVEGVMAIVFGMLFVAAIVSVAKGAWWHIVTAVISAPLCYMMACDVKKKCEDEEQYYRE